MAKRKCLVCGESFAVTGRNHKYCSPECSLEAAYDRRATAGKYERTCTECGKAFRTSDHRKMRCSRACFSACLSKRFTDRIELKCEVCGKVCLIPPSGKATFKFCSRECKAKGRTLAGFVDLKCRHCGKPYRRLKSRSGEFCGRKCSLEFLLYNTTRARLLADPPVAEVIVKNLLDALEIRYEWNAPMHGLLVDFYLPDLNIALEIDGNWHTHRKMAESDDRRDYKLKRHAIRTVRLKDSEVIGNPSLAGLLRSRLT